MSRVTQLRLTWKYCSLVITDERNHCSRADFPKCANRASAYPIFCIWILPSILRACPQLQSLSFQMMDPAKRALCFRIEGPLWREIQATLAEHTRVLKALSWLQYRTADHEELEKILQVCPKLECLSVHCNRYFKLSIRALRLTPLSSLRVLKVSWNDGSQAARFSMEWSSQSISDVTRMLKVTPQLERLKIARYSVPLPNFQRMDYFDPKYPATLTDLLGSVTELVGCHLVELRLDNIAVNQEARAAFRKLEPPAFVFLNVPEN
jgi:hypothetical protein